MSYFCLNLDLKKPDRCKISKIQAPHPFIVYLPVKPDMRTTHAAETLKAYMLVNITRLRTINENKVSIE